jgi:hypothetical protein
LEPTEKYLSYPRLTEVDRDRIRSYISFHPPPPEFQEDVDELFALMKLCRDY